MTKIIDMDMVAEMHYADRDPAYYVEEDLMDEKERIEEKVLIVFESSVKRMLSLLDDRELQVLADNREIVADWIVEVLEEYE